MFRALLLFPPGTTKVTMEAPISVTLVDDPKAQPVELSIKPDAVFTTAVGHSSKRTLAAWHVTTPGEVVDHMLSLVKDVPYTPVKRETSVQEAVEQPPADAEQTTTPPAEKANL
jgi:trehalose 6-phosphate synthase/phosphatase